MSCSSTPSSAVCLVSSLAPRMMPFCRLLTRPTAMMTARIAAKHTPSLPESFIFWNAFMSLGLRIGASERLRLAALQLGEVHFDRRGADWLAGIRIDHGEIELG